MEMVLLLGMSGLAAFLGVFDGSEDDSAERIVVEDPSLDLALILGEGGNDTLEQVGDMMLGPPLAKAMTVLISAAARPPKALRFPCTMTSILHCGNSGIWKRATG